MNSGSRWPSTGRAKAAMTSGYGLHGPGPIEDAIAVNGIGGDRSAPALVAEPSPRRLITRPSRMSLSDTRHSSKPSWRMICTSTHSRRRSRRLAPSSRPGLCDAVGARLGGERAEHVLDGRPGQHEVVDAVAVVLGEPDLDRRGGRTVPASPTNARGVGQVPGCSRSDVVEVRSRRPTDAASSSSGRGGSCSRYFSVSRTQPMSTDVRVLASVRAVGELGRAAADVDDEERAVGRGRARRSRRGTTAGLPRRPTAARAATPTILAAAAKNSSRLAASRAARGGRHAQPRHAVAVDALRGTRGAPRGSVRSRRVPTGPVASTSSPRRVMRISRSTVRVAVVHEQPRRVRAAVDRGVAHASSPSPPRWSATHRPTGSSPPARYHA